MTFPDLWLSAGAHMVNEHNMIVLIGVVKRDYNFVIVLDSDLWLN